jgi:hypothetical protein
MKGRNAYRRPRVTGVTACSSAQEKTSAPPAGRPEAAGAVLRKHHLAAFEAVVEVHRDCELPVRHRLVRVVPVGAEVRLVLSRVTAHQVPFDMARLELVGLEDFRQHPALHRPAQPESEFAVPQRHVFPPLGARVHLVDAHSAVIALDGGVDAALALVGVDEFGAQALLEHVRQHEHGGLDTQARALLGGRQMQQTVEHELPVASVAGEGDHPVDPEAGVHHHPAPPNRHLTRRRLDRVDAVGATDLAVDVEQEAHVRPRVGEPARGGVAGIDAHPQEGQRLGEGAAP